MLVLRFFAAFLGGAAPDDPVCAGKELAQVLLGLDPAHRSARGDVDVDVARALQHVRAFFSQVMF